MPAPTTTTSHSLGGSALAATTRSYGWALRRIAGRGAAAEAPRQAPARAVAQAAARGRGVGVRAEVRRLPGAGLRRRRQALRAVAERQAARPLLPRARASRGLVRDRRRAGDPRRRRRRGLRRSPEPHPPGRVADQHAGRGDAGRSSAPSTCSRSAKRRRSRTRSRDGARRSSGCLGVRRSRIGRGHAAGRRRSPRPSPGSRPARA